METRKQKKGRFQIEKLEERIAPCTLTVVPPANSAAGSNPPSSVPPGGATVNSNAAAANGAGPVTVSC
jgi:hypothetical protein